MVRLLNNAINNFMAVKAPDFISFIYEGRNRLGAPSRRGTTIAVTEVAKSWSTCHQRCHYDFNKKGGSRCVGNSTILS